MLDKAVLFSCSPDLFIVSLLYVMRRPGYRRRFHVDGPPGAAAQVLIVAGSVLRRPARAGRVRRRRAAGCA